MMKEAMITWFMSNVQVSILLETIFSINNLMGFNELKNISFFLVFSFRDLMNESIPNFSVLLLYMNCVRVDLI